MFKHETPWSLFSRTISWKSLCSSWRVWRPLWCWLNKYTISKRRRFSQFWLNVSQMCIGIRASMVSKRILSISKTSMLIDLLCRRVLHSHQFAIQQRHQFENQHRHEFKTQELELEITAREMSQLSLENSRTSITISKQSQSRQDQIIALKSELSQLFKGIFNPLHCSLCEWRLIKRLNFHLLRTARFLLISISFSTAVWIRLSAIAIRLNFERRCSSGYHAYVFLSNSGHLLDCCSMSWKPDSTGSGSR